MELIRLENKNNEIFKEIIEWNYNWWGHNIDKDVFISNMEHSLNSDKLPQTYVAVEGNIPLGLFQIAYFDDLEARPDLSPWLINVFVGEKYRKKGVFNFMMNKLPEVLEKIQIKRLFLYTYHNDLYEKYGFKHIDDSINKNKEDIVKIYEYNI